ncbi:MAG: hypothetical protein R3E36_14340 [Nitrosomonas sp.]|nr:hypothetical protein [Nitrosomonas sp.]MDR4521740.1 hypothetical protein [Nitrosomonas sp.]
MSKQSKKPDLSQLAKRIVDEAIGDALPEEEIDEKKKAAIESGRHKKEKRKNVSNID